MAGLGIVPPKLDAQLLVRHAERKTALSNFGDPSFRVGLERLTRALGQEAQLTPVGRFIAYWNLLDYLCVRLRLVEARRQRPEIAQQRVQRPLIILGLPRTGTTVLFELIAQDPAMRSPASWEVSQPCPPPQADSYGVDPRIKASDRLLRWSERLAPGFKTIHALGAQLPQECVYILASSFFSEQFGYMYNIPQYRAWLLQQNMTQAYRWHAQFLQHLQVDMPRERWLLKTPAHLANLEELFGQYPDAAVVWTHRRPLHALSSFSSLACKLRSSFSDQIDPLQIGPREFTHYADVVRNGLAQRAQLDDSHFFDVSFEQICAQPLAAVADIYSHFGWQLSTGAKREMQAYLERRPRHLYGIHRYTPETYGLSATSEAAQFSDYCGRFHRFLN